MIGNGDGHWDVPVGGMGAITAALAGAARAAGAEIRCGVEVDGRSSRGACAGTAARRQAEHVLANVAPAVLAQLLGEPAPDPPPEGAQLKLNMLLSRLPRLRDPDVDPRDAFAGTFHVNESATPAADRVRAGGRAARSRRCRRARSTATRSPTRRILGPELQAAGAADADVLRRCTCRPGCSTDPAAKERAVAATLRSLDSVLAEPIEDCLWRTPDGEPCLEARTPPELEAELGLPAGNIFHRDLAWPYAEDEGEAGGWGVETPHPRVLLCGAGARRGGGVSGIPGRNAAMAVLRGDVAATPAGPCHWAVTVAFMNGWIRQ